MRLSDDTPGSLNRLVKSGLLQRVEKCVPSMVQVCCVCLRRGFLELALQEWTPATLALRYTVSINSIHKSPSLNVAAPQDQKQAPPQPQQFSPKDAPNSICCKAVLSKASLEQICGMMSKLDCAEPLCKMINQTLASIQRLYRLTVVLERLYFAW